MMIDHHVAMASAARMAVGRMKRTAIHQVVDHSVRGHVILDHSKCSTHTSNDQFSLTAEVSNTRRTVIVAEEIQVEAQPPIDGKGDNLRQGRRIAPGDRDRQERLYAGGNGAVNSAGYMGETATSVSELPLGIVGFADADQRDRLGNVGVAHRC